METESSLIQVLFFSLLGGAISLIGGVLLLRSKSTAKGLALYATPFAAGVLLAAAFTDLLPEAMEFADARDILLVALLGMLGFFILERYLRFFHHHHEHEDKSSSSLIIIGDTLHNALDGVAIGAAFLIDPTVGIITTIAVAAHEIPQEIGDFGLLLKNGLSRTRVLVVNALSAIATTIASVLTFTIGDAEHPVIPYLLAVTAGFFIYIAASDIIPEIHENLKTKQRDIRPWLLIFGALLMMIVSPLAHQYMDAHSHDDEHSSVHSDDYEDEHDEEHDDEVHNDEVHHEGEEEHTE